MAKYVTEYRIYQGDKCIKYEGPRIKADSFEEAQEIADNEPSVFNYSLCVVGRLVMEFGEFSMN